MVYASTYKLQHQRLWQQIEKVMTLGLHLLLIGDFNYIVNEENKKEDKLFKIDRDI